jgi:O-antigen/teichoic acid export membrane protein
VVRRLLTDNLIRAGVASSWVVVGRLIGLAWTLSLLFRLGVSEYGIYAMAFALAAIVAAPIDNLFHVRSLRIADELYVRERSARALVGGVILVAGLALYLPAFVVGFALIVAGGEILFNSLKSDALRAGQPQRSVRLDVARQGASIVLGASYLYSTADPQLNVAAALYLLPYVVVGAIAGLRAIRARPALHGSRRELTLLLLDALGLALYLQGDILVLGLVAGSDVAGIYSIASVIALAASSVAQVFVQTYNERMRLAGGDPAAGPRRSLWAAVTVVLGIGVAVIGWIVWLVQPDEAIVPVLLVMSVFAALRSVSIILTSFLYVQHRDGHRVLAGGVAAVVKLALIVLVSPVLGALGAALAAVVVELMVAIWFYRVVYSWRPGLPTAATPAPPPSEVLP